jgi:hypothetical protein
MADIRTFIRNEYDTQDTAAVDARVMSLSGTSSGGAALALAGKAYDLACIGTNVGTNALNAAAAAQFTADSAVNGVTEVFAIAVAGTNLARAAYDLAAIGTNVGTNAYNLASAKVSILNGQAYNLTVDSSGPPSTNGLIVKGLGITVLTANDEGIRLYNVPDPVPFGNRSLLLLDEYGAVSTAGSYYYLDGYAVLRGSGTGLTGVVLDTRLISTASPLTGGGDLSSNRTLGIIRSTGTTDGYLSFADWNTFNSKQAALGFTPPPNTRLINTTTPLAGGGDLTADRTLSIANAAADGATKGAAAFNATNFTAASGIVNTIQNINTTASPQFTAVVLGNASIRPTADSATALRVMDSTNSIAQMTFNTTNRRVSIPTTLLVAANGTTYSAAITVAPSYTTQPMTDHIAGCYLSVTANNAIGNPFNTYSFAGLRCAVSKTNAGFAEAVYGATVQVVTSSSGNVNNAWGGYFVNQHIGTGTVTTQVGGYFYRQCQTGGVVTNSYGFYLNNPAGAGNIVNNYGVYIENQTRGITRNYALYSAGGQSYFAGNVGLNTLVPACRLTVSSADTGTTEDEIRLINTSAGAASRHGIGWYTANNAKTFARLSAEFGAAYVANKFHIEVGDSSGVLQDRLIINSVGNVGFGVTAPSAVLHLKAGTTAASTAPVKFSAGTLMTAAEAGAMEYATNFYLTPSSGVRYKVPLVPGSDYQAPLSQANATTNGYLSSGDWNTFNTGATTALKAFSLACIGTNVGTNAYNIAVAGSNLAAVAVPTLPGDRTYYVRTDGNDTNTGLVNTAGGAFLTIQRGIDVASLYDLGVHTVVIQVADGTYTGTLEIGPTKARPIHTGTPGWLIIRGNTVTPSNVSVIGDSSGHAICASMQSRVRLESFKISASNVSISNLVNAQLSSVVRIDNLVFGSLANANGQHITAEAVAQVSLVGNYTVAAGAYNHIRAMMGSTVWASSGLTVTLSGTNAFTQFCRAETDSAIYLPSMTFVGVATGSKFSAVSNGVIDLDGAAVDYLPGSTPGTVATGGQYLGTGNTPATVISTNTTFYVRTDGNDANTGMFNTAAGAWLTIQHAVDTIAGCIVYAGVTVTIQVGDGTYNEAVVTRKIMGGGSFVVTGNTGTPANCIIQGGASPAVSGGSQLPWTFSGFELRSTSSDCATVSGSLNFGAGIRFGAAGLSHVRARLGGKVQLQNSYAIAGAAPAHFICQTAGMIFVTSGITVTISGTPAFSTAFALVDTGGFVQVPSVTFSGSATGVRYALASGGILDAGGAIFSYLPGDTAGTAVTGGQYLGSGITSPSTIATNTTYYVDVTNGNNANDGLAAGAGRAFQTIQQAVNVVTGLFINSGIVVTIQIADGTYNEAVTLRPITGGGTITIIGNTGTPTNVIVQGGSSNAFTTAGGAVGYTLTGMEIRSTSAAGLAITGSTSVITVGASIVFGTCSTNHIRVINSSVLSLTSSYTISGGSGNHYSLDRGGTISVTGGITITLSGTPGFTNFVSAASNSCLTAKSLTFSGSATGIRYTGTTLALIDTASGSATYFPGDVGGSVATGAVYT